ncbi:MAG: SUMF1/EgtB/PvdO family nonheme iron enzyme, partial [Verrucomicrobiota bacterium]
MRGRNIAPDFVCVTGDLAFSGQRAEYDSARSFLEELASTLNLAVRKQFFIVPGNHDVDRKATMMTAGLRSTITEENAAQFFNQSPLNWTTYAQRQQEFIAFTGRFLGESRGWTPGQPWTVEFVEKEGFRVALLCLNSAWACQDEKDREQILLGEYQVRNALDRANEQSPNLKLALVHHPLDWLKPFDRQAARSLLYGAEGVHILHRGHLHEAEFGGALNPSAATFELAAGACWQGADQPHSVLAVQIDSESETGKVHAWSYSSRGGGFWAPDNQLYAGMHDGVWSFTLPESWQLKARAAPAVVDPADRPLIPEPYRRQLAGECGDVETLMGADSPLVFRLKNVYVPLKTDWTDPETRRKAGEGPDPERPENMVGKTPPERPLADLLDLDEHRHFLISGGPGTGKSTFIRFSALSELDRTSPRLPLKLALKDFGPWLAKNPGDTGNHLPEWAGSMLDEFGLGSEFIIARSGRGEVLWLLDGLDEIFDEAVRLRAAKIIGKWIGGDGARDGLLITARPHAVQQEGIVQALKSHEHTASIKPLGRDDQHLFLERWFHAVYGADEGKKAGRIMNELWYAMETHQRVGDLRDNPLHLSSMASIYHQDKKLPDRRADLFGKSVDILLHRRFGPTAEGSEALVGYMRRGLIAVARHMQEQGQVRDIGSDHFRTYLQEGYFGDRDPTLKELFELEDHAHSLAAGSGLLTMVGDPPQYRFLHLGFQEYLAAQSFGQERHPVKALTPWLDEGAWREVILLTAGFLGQSGAGRMAEDFVGGLKERYEAEPERINRLCLALQAAAEAPGPLLPQGLKEELRALALTIVRDPESDYRRRDEAALALGELGDPRLGMENRDRWVRIEPGSFRMGAEPDTRDVQIEKAFYLGRFPVTNAEYRTFMDDGGYSRKDFWDEEGWRWLQLDDEEFEQWFKEWKADFMNEEDKEFLRPESHPKSWTDTDDNRPNQPVVGVNWFEAGAYCRWLTRRLGSAESPWWDGAIQIRLPTEVEWEFAARGEENRWYPWGEEEPNPERANYNASRLSRTSAVGVFPAGQTPSGLYDLAGNIWEWCADEWDDDPRARAVRGGSWVNPSPDLASAFRGGVMAGSRGRSLGFRCCLAAAAEH